ncbi:MAG: adenylate/guanylate cyclase domain-containing protein [Rhodospirillaceae bacterium]|nr:adenylate/guanylate cyclase domain-containing protein [Rhodospirillaceae bacterium]
MLSRLRQIGMLPDDGAEVVLQKNLLVFSTAMMAAAAILWGGIYLYFGEPLAAAIPLGYSDASAFSILLFAKIRRYRLFRTSQLTFAILLPFLLMISLGGFVPSSGVILWAIVAPLGALLFTGRREAVAWMAALVCLLILAAWLDRQDLTGTSHLPPLLITVLFASNIIGLSAVAFALTHYFVGEKNRALHLVAVERRKSDELLANILPDAIAQRLKSNDRPIADGLDNVPILFADIVGFTQFATRRSPEKVVSLLDEVFSALDDLADRHGLEKIKTVGDAYMVAGGLPVPNPDHAHAVADFALDLLQCLDRMRREKGHDVTMRIGIHTGPVVAGVIGKRKYSYDVWGDTVNVAARLEQAGKAGHILLSAQTRAQLGDGYDCDAQGAVEIAGHAPVQVFELLGVKPVN